MPGPSYVQVLGGGSPDGGVSLLLFFDEHRYIFSCSEGTQRFCASHHLRLNRLQAVFLSRLEWTRSGGFPGLLCTVADAGGIGKLRLVGPANTNHFVATLRPFLRRSLFELTVTEVGSRGANGRREDGLPLAYSDDCITVYAIEVFDIGHQDDEGTRIQADSMPTDSTNDPSQTGSEAKRRKTPPRASPFDANAEYCTKMFKDLQSREEACQYYNGCEEDYAQAVKMPKVQRRGSSLCFLVQGPPVPGKFDAKQAKELGVPPGPLYSRLTRGESVELQDGRTVGPEECVGKSCPGSFVLLLDVANHGQVQDLHRQLARVGKTVQDGRLEIVFHLADPELFHTAEYQELAVKSLIDCRHVWVNGTRSIIYPAPLAIMKDLHHAIDPHIFPLPTYTRGEDDKICGVEWAAPLTRYKWNARDKHIVLDSLYATALRQALDEIYSTPESHEFPSEYAPSLDNPIVTFLGTGAALPGKYRNVSSTLVDYGDSAYLLDCGEGTFGQLFRRFPREVFMGLLNRLRGIFISHLHADHQLGVPGILSRLPPHHQGLVLVAPERYSVFLQELAECSSLGATDPVFFASEALENCVQSREQAAIACGLSVLNPVPVTHCPHSYGFVFRRPSALSPQIVFSGDTRPCALLVAAGQGSQILIHEATFCAALADEAIAKRHSTVTEAIGVGMEMAVDCILLTHVSQRYAKTIPPCPRYHEVGRMAVAVDFMSLSWDQMRSSLLSRLVPQMLAVMPDEEPVKSE